MYVRAVCKLVIVIIFVIDFLGRILSSKEAEKILTALSHASNLAFTLLIALWVYEVSKEIKK
jgi:hypothetical protein